MQHLLAGAAILGALVMTAQTVSAAPPARAAMTCRQFVSIDEVTRPKVVYWAEGLSRKGRPQDAVVDVDETERLIPVVTEACRRAPQASFWTELEQSWDRMKADVHWHL